MALKEIERYVYYMYTTAFPFAALHRLLDCHFRATFQDYLGFRVKLEVESRAHSEPTAGCHTKATERPAREEKREN